MPRNRASAKNAGTKFETDVGRYLTLNLGTKVYRTGKKGSMDIGDLEGYTINGKNIVLECKSPGKNSNWTISEWWKETEAESKNYGTDTGILVVSMFGKSIDKSACIMSEEHFLNIFNKDSENFKNIDFIEIKSNVTHIKDNIDEEVILTQKRRGSDTPWYIFTLSLLIDIGDRKVPRVSVVKDKNDEFLSYTGVDGNGIVFDFIVTDSDKEALILTPEKSNVKSQYCIEMNSNDIQEFIDSQSPILDKSPYPIGFILNNGENKENKNTLKISQEELKYLLDKKEISVVHDGKELTITI